MRNLFLIPMLIACLSVNAQISKLSNATKDKSMTSFEKNPNTTATYEETISFYNDLAEKHSNLQFLRYGITDSGYPLHLAVISNEEDFQPSSIRKKGKRILLINNAIHPGEPCGVDASMMLVRDYLEQASLSQFLEHTVIVIIPFYNIGGGLNRNSHTRTNQLGPEAYGFRGNAKNLDLNRDFVKCDSRNAQTFNYIFNRWKPDIFIDNHTSNGADYQYTMTLIATQHNKLDKHLGKYLNDRLLPYLYKDMKARNWEMTPYVYARNTPDEGIIEFLDLARYSSGYAALHNTIAFMPETHMLKPYKDRVESTYQFMDSMIKLMHADHELIGEVKAKAIENTKTKKLFALNWELDTEKVDKLLFKGYTAKYKASEVSGLDRLYYDRNEPYEKEIPYLRNYKTTTQVEKPIAYIIPQAYVDVIERLEVNKVSLQRLRKDTVLEVAMYQIKDYKDRAAYEGHYLHYDIEVEKEIHKWSYRRGDFVIYTNQASNRYIMETLEPHAPDSYFAWNFFDGILMQKEYFSPYVFEDLAAKYLQENPQLKQDLDAKKKADEAFAKDAYAQLDFIYKNTAHYEYTHKMYPVGRLEKDIDLPVVIKEGY